MSTLTETVAECSARLCQLLKQSDDRGLCRAGIELAFRLSPSNKTEDPKQREWVRHVFSTAAFGRDAGEMRNKFNNLTTSDFEKASPL